MTQKDRIRKKIIKIRKSVDSKTVASNSRKILIKLFRMKEFRQAKKVMFYSSFGNEVDTRWMIEKSLKFGKQVFLPKVIEDKIVPIQIENLKNLVRGKFGIYEPQTTFRQGDPATTSNFELRTSNFFDVVIVPGVAFDKNCNRLGFGGGYFDRFLKMQKAINPALPKGFFRKGWLKIGLAHSFQIVQKIPVSKKDVPMDFVITEKGTQDRRGTKRRTDAEQTLNKRQKPVEAERSI
ncbi:MAG: 5-formyltetrahydrofolate cyclo-ligase [Elusimicrobiota bacterium]